jgi:2,3-dihydro-2,3-dihydroxybenzoate dehydrogenase
MPDASTADLSTRLDGRVALIVGAGGGIGEACVQLFAEAGATLAAADLSAPDAAAASSAHVVDVTSEESVRTLIAEVANTYGHLDAAVICSGVLVVRPALETSADEWDHHFAVNARGTFLVAREVAKVFVEQKRPGRLVAFGSIVATIVRPNNVAYCASKAAIVQAARCLALDLAPHEITVNVVSPGSTATPMLANVQMGDSDPNFDAVVGGDLAGWRLGIPLGRVAEPRDQASAALFLCTDAARHITGQELIVDGGQTIV